MKRIFTLLVILTTISFSANAQTSPREKGVIARIGAGAPANFNLGLGYQFSPHFSLTGEAYSYSGLTSMAGTVDARYYVSNKSLTPFVDVRAGYGVLGTTMENKKYYDMLGAVSAGLSWRRLDFGVGVICDSFHKAEFTANLSWTIKLGR